MLLCKYWVLSHLEDKAGQRVIKRNTGLQDPLGPDRELVLQEAHRKPSLLQLRLLAIFYKRKARQGWCGGEGVGSRELLLTEY